MLSFKQIIKEAALTAKTIVKFPRPLTDQEIFDLQSALERAGIYAPMSAASRDMMLVPTEKADRALKTIRGKGFSAATIQS